MLAKFLGIAYLLLITLPLLYTLTTFSLLLIYLFAARRRTAPPAPAQWPTVTVQIPLYNERYVAEQTIRAAAALDYPRDRLHIQVLDDSTDDTIQVVERAAARCHEQGVNIIVVRRPARTGYKSGALAHGLSLTDSAFIAVLDADFTPLPGFLRQVIPHLVADPVLGLVQTRWGHHNPNQNLLTQIQTLMLDGHFVIEQTARAQGHLLGSFSGSGGVWRRECIESAGGWSADTLAEDCDLSIRAQLGGWRFGYLPDTVVPGQIAPSMRAFKQQQARWAQGTTQVLLRHGRALLRSRLPWHVRWFGLMQISPYLNHLLGLLLLLLLPLFIITDALAELPLGPMGWLSLVIPLTYLIAQVSLYGLRSGRLIRFVPAMLGLVIVAAGLAVSNSRAVWGALRGERTEFRRTPKTDGSDGNIRLSVYRYVADPTRRWEWGIGLYALMATALSAAIAPIWTPYFGLYAVGLLSVALWSFAEARNG